MRLLWVAQFVNTAGLMALVPIMPLYMAVLGAPSSEVGVWAGAAIAAPALPLAITTPLWGRLGDRVGSKWMVVRSLLGLCLAMGLMAVADGPLMLLLARVLQGTFGGVVEAATAYVGSASAAQGRGRSLGRSYSATAAGALAGPVAGGVLVSTGHLQMLLIGVACAALLLGLACAKSLENRRVHRSTRSGGTRREGRLLWACGRIGSAPLVGGFLAYLGVYGLIPIYAVLVGQLAGPRDAGLWVGGLHAVMWAGTFLGSLWWGKRNDRHGNPLRTWMIACGVVAATILAQGPIAWLPVLVPLRLIQGFCFAALAQSLLLHASQRSDPPGRAFHIGVANSFLLGGQFFGPLAAGALTATLAAPTGVLISGGVVCLGGIVVLAATRQFIAGPDWQGQRDLDRVGRS